jgi:penicillin-insensitive murein DD-endopeptidase
MGYGRPSVRALPFCLALLLGAAAPARAGHEVSSANELFGVVSRPTDDRRVEVVGSYTRGCIRGAVELPTSGPGWQVMRLSRNRDWGHPALVGFVERLAAETRREEDGGLLVGDMGQPRGGPMRFGHASHQIGLDVDVWLMPPPARLLSLDERESLIAASMLKGDAYAVDLARFGRYPAALIRRAAGFSEVERVFVSPGIKKALCAAAEGDRSWLRKVRPWYGHDDHMHVRLRCPPGQPLCRGQDPPPEGDGCGGELRWWLGRASHRPRDLLEPAQPVPLAGLPAACREVLREP